MATFSSPSEVRSWHAAETVRQARAAAESDAPACEINVGSTERLLSGLGGAALAAYGLGRRSTGGLVLALVGGALAWRGVTGHCHAYEALGVSTHGKDRVGYHEPFEGVKVRKAFTVNKSPADCYAYWRNFENLPRFMTHLASVRVIDETHSHWEVNSPTGGTLGWDAEIIADRTNELISWRSIGEADVNNAGSVSFKAAPGGRGTEVVVELNYEPPAGTLGRWVAWFLGEEPENQVQEDLRHFKQVMEAGEIATVQGQPSGRDAGHA